MKNQLKNTDFLKFISKMNIDKLNIPTTSQEEWRFTNLNFLKKKKFNSNIKHFSKSLDENLKSNQKNQIYFINNIIQNNFQKLNAINGLDILNIVSRVI